MEKTMSVEEKIRRAEEIYAKRQEGKGLNTTRVGIYRNEKKKDIKLLKKMFKQIIVCLLIYLVIYIIQNGNYIFSEDFLNKVNEIISYDTNFEGVYKNIKSKITSILNQSDNNNQEGQNNEGKNNGQEDENIGGDAEQTENINQQVQDVSQVEADIQTAKNTTSFIKPIEGKVSSKYGHRNPTTASVPKNHTGLDIAAGIGTKIKSATAGEVVLKSSEGDYGNHLKIQIGEISVIYAHCNALYVNQGDKVEQGQEIAEVGTTGNSTGSHLHFEIRVSERTIDPQSILEI